MTEDRSAARVFPAGWRCPVVWGAGVFAFAVFVALAAPTSSDPAGRIGLALCVGGGAVTLLAALGREWRLLPVTTASAVGGALLIIDAQRYIVSVTRGGAVIVLLAGFAVARLAAQALGRLAGVVVATMAVAVSRSV